ncbi:DUF4426 domain-containing protein [Thalassotalea aquiviva]|uniref:DUF4426 domain-containing protein n=1 Tax=Thalassotalea aquiviva TaxID=3242415 RepID=UPI003529EDDF
MKEFDGLEVHYIGLSTSILQPNIAKNYGIERSRYTGFVNISVLDSTKPDKPAKKVALAGYATNLVGQRIPLEFDQIIEGKAIYYIALVDYPNDETYNFNIRIFDQGKEHLLKFSQKFYVNP